MRPFLRLCERGLSALSDARLRQNRTWAGRRKALGEAGERRAYFHLRRAGYTVVARQWRAPNVDGEIDLIAWCGETLCFVEVKTRGSSDRFSPERAIDRGKRTALRRMARAYVRGIFHAGMSQPELRFDVVTVLRLRKEWRVTLDRDAFAFDGEV